MANVLSYSGICAVVMVGLLSAGVGHAQSDLSPAKSNCDSKTGCANYATGNVTSQNPMQQGNSNAPYNQSGTNPAQSNCDSKTGCASYSTGDQTKVNPTQPQQKSK
ncbi:MAG TPA: hypothetical protein VG328_16305 [Stellaceae bacterium]|jgi:hypothetical protein|nr:hypothetical protein [Stellaceae bacterium]